MTLVNCTATFRFSGRTYPKLARIVRALCAAAGRCRLPLVAAISVNSVQSVRRLADLHLAGDGSRSVRQAPPGLHRPGREDWVLDSEP